MAENPLDFISDELRNDVIRKIQAGGSSSALHSYLTSRGLGAEFATKVVDACRRRLNGPPQGSRSLAQRMSDGSVRELPQSTTGNLPVGTVQNSGKPNVGVGTFLVGFLVIAFVGAFLIYGTLLLAMSGLAAIAQLLPKSPDKQQVEPNEKILSETKVPPLANGNAKERAPAQQAGKTRKLNADDVKIGYEEAFRNGLLRLRRDPIDERVVYGADSDGTVYRFTLPKGPLCDVIVKEDRKDGFVRFSVELTPHVKVALKRDTGIGRQSFEAKFPALMPYSAEVDLAPLSIEHFVEESANSIPLKPLRWDEVLTPAKQSTSPFDLLDLKPLDASQLAFFLNLDQSPFLSEEGKSHYAQIKRVLPTIIPTLNGSFFMINGNDDYVAAGDIVEEHDLLNFLMNSVTKDMTFPTETFEVTEVRGAGLQYWITESTPNDVQMLNGMKYRADVKVGLRGYSRTRTVEFFKSTAGKDIERRQSAWSEWNSARTFTAKMSISRSKNADAVWTSSIGSRKVAKVPNQSKKGTPAVEGSDLNLWALRPTTIRGFLELIEPGTNDLKEPLTLAGWSR